MLKGKINHIGRLKAHANNLRITLSLVLLLCLLIALAGCNNTKTEETQKAGSKEPYLVVLGIAQDGGFPQAGCKKSCCANVWDDPSARRHVACIAIVDPKTSERWIIDTTPDFNEQLRFLDNIEPPSETPGLAGILLTHAHIGHYTGLMHLGHESMGAKNVPVYVMPRMFEYLSTNGPWDQLVRFKNISLHRIDNQIPIQLNSRISITPFLVPHRDEYSETVGYRIDGLNRSAIFIPDIDKWEKWDTPIEDVISTAAVAYLDGTFYEDGEIPGRNMENIPHPFISESMNRFGSLSLKEKAKIRFIHLNHTNPALIPGSQARKAIEAAGFHVAEESERVGL